MPLKIGTEIVSEMKIGTEIVGGMKIGTEIIYSSEEETSGVMYAVGSDPTSSLRNALALYTIDITTGTLTKITQGNTFGITGGCGGLAWDGTNLYMIEYFNSSTRGLYTIDRMTGIVTKVGSATNFGANLTNPRGLAWDGTNLYMSDQNTDNLYTVDRTTGIATRVGRSTDFNLSGSSHRLFGLVWNGTYLYAQITYSRNDGTHQWLLLMNRTEGFSARGWVIQLNQFGGLGDMTWDGTNAYILDTGNRSYYTLNLALRGVALGERITNQIRTGNIGLSGLAFVS